ncbi:unnamed protein product [Pylaiella littoralis]
MSPCLLSFESWRGYHRDAIRPDEFCPGSYIYIFDWIQQLLPIWSDASSYVFHRDSGQCKLIHIFLPGAALICLFPVGLFRYSMFQAVLFRFMTRETAAVFDFMQPILSEQHQ